MTPQAWARVKALFEAASAIPAHERQAFLQRSGAPESTRRAVAQLLAAADTPSHVLVGGIGVAARRESVPADPDPLIGQRIGPYRVLREIGRGGMSTVFLGIRPDHTRDDQVAIKVVRRGLDIEGLVRRFRAEREILAMLSHPHICRLIDGGVTSDGRPYLVEEFVDGLPLLDSCRRRRLDVDARLRLFTLICGAVHHAHQHRVIHRDLKPSNILVDRNGQPRLVDFGIAKILHPLSATSDRTDTSARVLTLDYASPEQVRGDTATPSFDVYALGVVLVELVTGRRTFGPATRANGVVPPSPASARHLAGDLEAIALKATAEHARDRYVSAEALARAVEAHLDGPGMSARGPSNG